MSPQEASAAPRSRRGHSAVSNALLSLLALALTVALAELLLEWAGIGDPPMPSRYRVPHPVLGWSLEPGAAYVNPLPEGDVSVAFNSRGWRDRERSQEKPAGTRRALVLGDSFMEAYSVPFEQSFAQRLERRLAGPGPPFEVVNMGVGGYGTLQEYLVFRDEGRLYAPDLVLLGFCTANDVRNNSPALEAAVTPDGYKLVSRPFLERGDRWEIVGPDAGAMERRFGRVVEQRDSLWTLLYARSSLLQLLRGGSLDLLQRWHGRADPEREELALLGVHYCTEPDEYRDAWRTTRSVLERLRDEVEAAGAKLIVFSVPTLRETDRSRMEAILRGSRDPGRLCLEEAPGYARLSGVLGELGVPFVDLLPGFRRAQETGQLFHRSDRHWNARGHDLAAGLVAQALGDGLRSADPDHARSATRAGEWENHGQRDE